MGQTELRPGCLLVFGLGYCGTAVARGAAAEGWTVRGTRRVRDGAGSGALAFDAAAPALADSTHLLATAPPDASGDPVLARYAAAIAAAPRLRWIGYLSSTGVYGDRAGGWVDEDTPPAPSSARARRRLAAEQQWRAFADRVPVDIFRVAGIYGPGRSPFEAIRAGTARRVDKPGHSFGRIHRDDIAAAVLAAMRQARPPGVRILNLADDLPAENAAVVAEAARLLGAAPPPLIPFAEALAGMSEMGRSFWAEHRRVASAKTKAALGIAWRYPTYREGLRAILLEQPVQGSPQ
ncbi:MAG: SDR family NAD(P)-dependent oxidoreductase [Alphaproteobacteria bacterium]|nr:SDR family NAD(P)-dependent oxidoreductase [Alphaproteobacteria bacterium]